MFCSNCGREYSGGTMICPYCGKNSQHGTSYVPYVQDKYNVCAIVGFVLSMVSLVFSFGGVTTIASVVLSSIALKQIKVYGEKGKGLAVAGLVIGIIKIVLNVIIIIFVVVMMYVLPSIIGDISYEWLYSI